MSRRLGFYARAFLRWAPAGLGWGQQGYPPLARAAPELQRDPRWLLLQVPQELKNFTQTPTLPMYVQRTWKQINQLELKCHLHSHLISKRSTLDDASPVLSHSLNQPLMTQSRLHGNIVYCVATYNSLKHLWAHITLTYLKFK